MRSHRKWVLGKVLIGCLGAAILLIAQTNLEESWEINSNKRHPPAKVMDMIGVKPGLIIGEIGAGRGRFTVHLAQRVGPAGKIYANDINQKGLDFINERCQRHNLLNVETVLGRVDDPLFPRKDLDMIFMVWVYHMVEKPVELLRSLAPYLKPGAAVVMLEPVPSETDDEIKAATAHDGKAPVGMHSVTSDNLKKDAEAAGFELVRTEPFSMDNLFVLRVKSAS